MKPRRGRLFLLDFGARAGLCYINQSWGKDRAKSCWRESMKITILGVICTLVFFFIVGWLAEQDAKAERNSYEAFKRKLSRLSPKASNTEAEEVTPALPDKPAKNASKRSSPSKVAAKRPQRT
jgi:predicted negative regulator of RcsB-dependent stress response